MKSLKNRQFYKIKIKYSLNQFLQKIMPIIMNNKVKNFQQIKMICLVKIIMKMNRKFR